MLNCHTYALCKTRLRYIQCRFIMVRTIVEEKNCKSHENLRRDYVNDFFLILSVNVAAARGNGQIVRLYIDIMILNFFFSSPSPLSLCTQRPIYEFY